MLDRTFEPRPLVFKHREFGVIWSAKSACTKVVSWYLKLTGLLHAAEFYHTWPHRFREDVLYNSAIYQRWVTLLPDPSTYDWYQFHRDPVKRALSAYRHNVLHPYAHHHLSREIGREVTTQSGFSLNEFLKYLTSMNVYGNTDIHIKSQVHPFSQFGTMINLDKVDMFEAMHAIEKKHDLQPTEFDRYPVFSRIDSIHNATSAEAPEFDPDRAYNAMDASGAWPVNDKVIDEETRAKIVEIYQKDVDFFASAPTLL